MKNKSDKTRPVYAPKKFGHLDDPRGSYLEFLRMCNHGSTKAEAYASFGIPWTPKKEEKAPEDSRAKQRARYHEKKAAQGIPSKEFGPLADRRKQTPEEKREKQRERDARRKPKAEKRAYRIMQYTEDERARIAAGATPEERDCIRSRIYYARNKETIAIKRKEWSKKHAEGYYPKKFARYADPLGTYHAYLRLQNAKAHRKHLEEMSEEELARFKAKAARKQRERRQKNPEAVREYQRNYHREWSKKNPDRAREIALRSALKKKAEKEIEKALRADRKKRKEKKKESK